MANIKCPHCGGSTPDVESSMGTITCDSCGKTFSSQSKQNYDEIKNQKLNAVKTSQLIKK